MKNKKGESIQIIILTVISVLFIAPIVIVFMNSFKSKLFINSTPFAFPNADSFVGLANYGEGMIKTGSAGIFYYFIYNCSLRVSYCYADFYDSMVSGPCKKPFYKSNVLSVCFCHDRTIPDGNVYAC